MTKIIKQIEAVETTIQELTNRIYSQPITEEEKKELLIRKETLIEVSENLNLLRKLSL